MLVEDAALTAPTNASADASPIARRQRSFLINIDFGAEQDRRSPATANHRNISDSRMLMTGKFFARGEMLLIFGGWLRSDGIKRMRDKEPYESS